MKEKTPKDFPKEHSCQDSCTQVISEPAHSSAEGLVNFSKWLAPSPVLLPALLATRSLLGIPPFWGMYPHFCTFSTLPCQNFFIITANNHRLQYPHPSHSPWALLEATPLLQSLCKIFLGKMSTFTTSKDTNLGVAEGLPRAQRNANRLFLLLAYCRQAQGFSCTPTDRFSPALQRHPHLFIIPETGFGREQFFS